MIQAYVEVIRRTEQRFQVLPKRPYIRKNMIAGLTNTIVERKDYERLPEMSEAAIYAVMTKIMLRRLVS